MGYRKRRRRYYNSKKMSEEEKTQWILTSIVFIICFIFYLLWGFISNCIFEWPIRWDVGACWIEQVKPAKEKAVEKAINFIP